MKTISSVLLLVFSLQAPLAQASNSSAFRGAVRDFRAELEQGNPDAVQRFLQRFQDSGATYEDLRAYLRERLTPAEFGRLEQRMTASLRGVEAEKLGPEEWAELLQPAFLETSTAGLSWTPCELRMPLLVTLWTLEAVSVVWLAYAQHERDRIDGLRGRRLQEIDWDFNPRISGATTAQEVLGLQAERQRAIDAAGVEFNSDSYNNQLVGSAFGLIGSIGGLFLVTWKTDHCEP